MLGGGRGGGGSAVTNISGPKLGHDLHEYHVSSRGSLGVIDPKLFFSFAYFKTVNHQMLIPSTLRFETQAPIDHDPFFCRF